MEKTSVRAEKRVQLDYVMMSDDFKSWFLGSYNTWKWCKRRRGDMTDHKGIVFRVRVKLARTRRNQQRRWQNLHRCSNGTREKFSAKFVSWRGI